MALELRPGAASCVFQVLRQIQTGQPGYTTEVGSDSSSDEGVVRIPRFIRLDSETHCTIQDRTEL